MDIRKWDERYRSRERGAEDFSMAPTPLLVETAGPLPSGAALDLACGTGRNALWLAERGWEVTAVDGAASAIRELSNRASEHGLTVETMVTDLEHGYTIEAEAWDLISICYYLQRDLFEPAKRGVNPGGILLAIVHITDKSEAPTKHRLAPGELKGYFHEWQILHYYEGLPSDRVHRHGVAEIVARKPEESSESDRP